MTKKILSREELVSACPAQDLGSWAAPPPARCVSAWASPSSSPARRCTRDGPLLRRNVTASDRPRTYYRYVTPFCICQAAGTCSVSAPRNHSLNLTLIKIDVLYTRRNSRLILLTGTEVGYRAWHVLQNGSHFFLVCSRGKGRLIIHHGHACARSDHGTRSRTILNHSPSSSCRRRTTHAAIFQATETRSTARRR